MNIWQALKLLTQPKRLRRLLKLEKLEKGLFKLEKDYKTPFYLRKAEDGVVEISGNPGYIYIRDMDLRIGKEGLTVTGLFDMRDGSLTAHPLDYSYTQDIVWIDQEFTTTLKPEDLSVNFYPGNYSKLIEDGLIVEHHDEESE